MNVMIPERGWLYLKKVADNPSGWIILCNLLDGLEQDLFGKEFAASLILCWMREYARQRREQNGKGVRAGQPLFKQRSREELLRDSFDAVCSASGNVVPCPEHPENGFLIHCQRTLHAQPPLENYTSITDARDFADERMHPAEKTERSGELWLIGLLDTSLVSWDSWRPANKTTVRLNPLGPAGRAATIGKPAKVLWITPETEVLRFIKQPSPADGLRDALGLRHLYNCQLLAMTLPKVAVESQAHGRPTVADAGSHMRHMAHSSSRSDGKVTPWGWTADLGKFANGVSNVDGLPERIVQPIPVASIPTVDVQALGSCGPERGLANGVDDNKTFAQMLCNKHGGTLAMMERVQEILA
ncbi:MAG: hypothetical protein HQL90_04630 [Magnetococcales bacterium]|nr:hypothetical protein [Magnetococcales bacterium]